MATNTLTHAGISVGRGKLIILIISAVIVVIGGVTIGRHVLASHQTTQNTQAAEALALKYEGALLSGDEATYCGLDPKPSVCLAAWANPDVRLTMPLHVVKAEAVQLTSPDAISPQAGTGVLLQCQIAGASYTDETAVFVTGDGKIGGRVGVTNEMQSQTLTQILSEGIR